jgi:hypothetical protein
MSHPPHLTREEQAKIEIGQTESTHAINLFLTGILVTLLLAVPVVESLQQWRTTRGRPVCAGIMRLFPTSAELWAVAAVPGVRAKFDQLRQLNNRILRDIGRYETDLKEGSVFVRTLIPPLQILITGFLRGGTEEAYLGREGWLFYRRDVDSVMGRGFLDPQVLAHRAAGGTELKAPPQPDPVQGIVHFRDQLAARGIELIVVPVPVKPTLHPEKFTARYRGRPDPVHNASYAEFRRRLEAARVHVLDPASALMANRSPEAPPLCLATDTHWTPVAMERVAGMIADTIRKTVQLPEAQSMAIRVAEQFLTHTGDIAGMLKLPSGHPLTRPESVTIRQVLVGNGFWRPDPRADVLLLGDSFANIYSLEALGWGESAGLAEQLSLALGRPVDALRRNDAGAWATRDMLARELAQGHDRLAGKRVVVWEFAARELAAGDWKLIPLRLGTPRPSVFFTPESGAMIPVSGFIRAIAPVPRPGSVPYKDHIVTLHVTDLEGSPSVPAGGQALIYVWSMRNNEWTAAARWLPGQRIELTLQAWSDVESRFDAINRAELNDDALMLETPCWGEVKP